MALVGDIILAARALGPDLPVSLGPPSGISVSVVSFIGSTLPAATYYVKVTQSNVFGESNPTTEFGPLTVGASQGISVTQAAGSVIPGISTFTIYLGTTAGGENQSVSSATLPFTIVAALTQLGAPPVTSNAYLPDTDGGFVSAYMMYTWLNEAIDRAGFTTTGVKDITGVQTQIGQGVYAIPGRWIKFEHGWFDGWECASVSASNMYFRNQVTGFSWLLDTIRVDNNNSYLRTWPQPNRTGGATTLSANMGVADQTASLAASNFTLPLGVAQIDTGANAEIVAYAGNAGNQLTGLVRGLGGTVASAHLSGVAVVECNFNFQGKRLPPRYSVGQSLLTVDISYGVDTLLSTYLLSKFREREQMRAEAKDLKEEFLGLLSTYNRTNLQLAGPKQAGGIVRHETYGTGLGGGWFIP